MPVEREEELEEPVWPEGRRTDREHDCFYPEEYPEIHEKRAEERVVGEICVRRLLRIAEGERGEGGGTR